MTTLAGMKFQLDIEFHDIDLQEAESYLKNLTSKYSDLIFDQQTKIHVKLEKGSLEVTLVVIGAIYIGIGQYASFRSGIDYMIKDAKTLKELVTSEIIRKGVNEADILDSKRLKCDLDRIRRVLLAIERLESKKMSEEDILKELSKIKTSVSNICHSLNNKDVGLFASSINPKYCPENKRITYFACQHKLSARQKEAVRKPITSIGK